METPLIHDWPTWFLWHIVILGTPIAISWAIAGYRRRAERRAYEGRLQRTHGCGSPNRKDHADGD